MTAHQLRKISIDQLQPGMYVGNVFNGRGVLLYSANTLIENYSQVKALRRQGVVEITINLQKGGGADVVSDQKADSETVIQSGETTSEAVAFEWEKVERTVTMHERVLDSVEEMMASARAGRLFSITAVTSIVDTIVDSILDEPDILLNLCQIRSHSTSIYTHSVNVAVLMTGFAAALGYDRDRILEAGVGGILHDIGMVRLPQELLQKRGVFTRQEFELFKKHPIYGLEVINQNGYRVSAGVRNIIGQHHERMNGSGYPLHLRQSQIDEPALVCAIADMYDSLTTKGMYQKCYLPQEALALIFQGTDNEYPRELIEHFTKLLGIYPVGSFVQLDSGEMGVVIKINRTQLLSPVVRVLFDKDGRRLHTPYINDLSATAVNNTDEPPQKVTQSLDPQLYHVTLSHDFL